MCVCVVNQATQPATLLEFGPDQPRRAYLLYNGNHYDALKKQGTTLFSIEPSLVRALDAAALALAESLRATSKPVKMLQCTECKAVMESKEAEEHSKKVNHSEEWCFDFVDA